MTSFVLADIRVPTELMGSPDGLGGRRLGEFYCGDLLFENSRAARFLPGTHQADCPVIDGRGQILTLGLVEAHCHLDKYDTIDRLDVVGGDLQDAIEKQAADKQRWSANDLRSRMRAGVLELQDAGCCLARTHIDWGGDETPLAWSLAAEVAGDIADFSLQAAALLSIDDFADPVSSEKIARQIANDHGVMGVFVLKHDAIEPKLRRVLSLAERFGLDLDFHVDEDLDVGQLAVETLADVVLDSRYEGLILCGHLCSLAVQSDEVARRVIAKLAQSNVSVVSLPTTNLYLQGRRPPQAHRGLTRIQAMRDAGINVCIGSDNVRDAFCPIGTLNPLHALETAVVAGHLDPPLGQWLKLVTCNARKALVGGSGGIEDVSVADLRLCEHDTLARLISRGMLVPVQKLMAANGVVS